MNTIAQLAPDALNEEPEFPEKESGVRRRLDYLGYAPCPIRAEMRRRLHKRFEAGRAEGRPSPLWYVPSGCHESNVYDEIWKTEDPDEFPGLVSEVGIGDFLQPTFVKRYFEGGLLEPVFHGPVREEFKQAGLFDQTGLYHVYGVLPYLILVDLKRLGARPVPESWSDLLDPRYRGDIVINGWENDIQEALLFNMYKDFGEDGLSALGSNVKDFWHPADMAKTAGTENPKGAALYVLPWFFAKSAPRTERTLLVWPKEGAYATPLYLVAKRGRRQESQSPLDFLAGEDWGSFLARAGFPPARTDSPQLPGKLRWLTWEYARSRDLEGLRAPLNAAFMKGRLR